MYPTNNWLNPDTENGNISAVTNCGYETKVEAQCKGCMRKAFKSQRFIEYNREKSKYECQFCEDPEQLVWVCTGIPLNALKRREFDKMRNGYHLGLAVQNDGTEFPCGEEYEESQRTGSKCRKCQNRMYFG